MVWGDLGPHTPLISQTFPTHGSTRTNPSGFDSKMGTIPEDEQWQWISLSGFLASQVRIEACNIKVAWRGEHISGDVSMHAVLRLVGWRGGQILSPDVSTAVVLVG